MARKPAVRVMRADQTTNLAFDFTPRILAKTWLVLSGFSFAIIVFTFRVWQRRIGIPQAGGRLLGLG
jgi:hypothetical protein